MKKQLLHVFFIFLAFQGFSQSLIPEFEFQLYFEDAAGNKDTVTLGYDVLATDSIDTAFGEVDLLNQTWGNGLDVRVGNKTYETIPQSGGPSNNYWPITWNNPNNSFQTKRQILSNVFCNNNFYRSDTISLQFVTKNLPIKITWNGSLFINNCNALTSFYGGQLWSSSDLTNGQGLSGLGMMEIQVKKGLNTDSLYVSYISELFPISTIIEGIDTIAFLHIIFEKTQSSSIAELFSENIHIFPNPFNEILNIRNLSNSTFQNMQAELYSLDGRVVLRQNFSNDFTIIHTESLEKGFYYLKIHDTDNNKFVSSLFIKQ